MKAAVIGVGRMGRRHAAVLRGMGFDIAGVSDPSEAALEAARTELGLESENLYRDPAQLLTSTSPEAVVIATTADCHAPLTLRAVLAGARYVLCEKPMAVSLAECDAMIAACKERDVRLAINHQRRYMPQFEVARDIVESPEFGGLRGMTVVAGNMGLAMNGSHFLEIFMHWTGETPRTIAASFSDVEVPNPRGAQFRDASGFLRVTTASGRRLTIDAEADAGHGLLSVYMGHNGQLVVDELTGVATTEIRTSEQRGRPTTLYGLPAEGSRQQFTADLNVAIRALWERLLAGESVPSGEDSRRVIECLVTAYVSHERGGVPVAFDPSSLPRERRFAWA